MLRVLRIDFVFKVIIHEHSGRTCSCLPQGRVQRGGLQVRIVPTEDGRNGGEIQEGAFKRSGIDSRVPGQLVPVPADRTVDRIGAVDLQDLHPDQDQPHVQLLRREEHDSADNLVRFGPLSESVRGAENHLLLPVNKAFPCYSIRV